MSAVFTAWWCCSVGTNWTVELRSVERSMLGRPLEWICSGIPTQQPIPEQHLADLLRERDLLLFPEEPVEPRTRSRRLIGYVTRDPEVMQLARTLIHSRDADGEHPMLIAARRIHAQRSTSCRSTLDLTGRAHLEQLIQHRRR
ncbi:MAG: hypothetical protein ACRDSR_25505 [Pseudonocardiaceae bacterium]